jgi:hypothetical protein
MVTPRERTLANRARPRQLDVEQRLKLRLSWLRRLYVFLWVEWNSTIRVPLRTRLRAWRHGFLATSWQLYDLERNDPADYLQDHRLRNYALFDRHRLALMEKIFFSYLMRALEVPQPRPLAFVQEGELMPLGADMRPGAATIGIDELSEDFPETVFRPIGGWGGRGVFFVRREAERFWVDRQPVSLDDLRSRIATLDQYMVTEYLTNADYAAAISPGRPNTLRLLTLWDVDQGAPFIAAATQRFGGADNNMADSFKPGTACLISRVDLGTGTLGPSLNIDRNGRLHSRTHSPVSGAPIEGVVVPHWQETTRRLLQIAAALPQFPLVGWDILMTNEGPYWLEGNSPTGIQLWQAHTPLLKDPRSRAFFEWLGAI